MGFFDSLRASLFDPVVIWEKFAAILPNIVATIVLILVGHFLGKFLAFVISRLLERLGLNRLVEAAGLGGAVENSGLNATPTFVLGKIIYWLIFLTFIISAADNLGLQRVSDMVGEFVAYLPKVVGALLVLVVGLAIAHVLRTGIEAALGGINLGYEKVVGNLVYAIAVVVVVSLAVNQLEIETALLNQVISIMLLSAAAAVALALGLGTRDVAGNIVAGVYARDLFLPGNRIKFGNVTGTIIEVGSTSMVIQIAPDKTMTVPNRTVLDSQVEVSVDV